MNCTLLLLTSAYLFFKLVFLNHAAVNVTYAWQYSHICLVPLNLIFPAKISGQQTWKYPISSSQPVRYFRLGWNLVICLRSSSGFDADWRLSTPLPKPNSTPQPQHLTGFKDKLLMVVVMGSFMLLSNLAGCFYHMWGGFSPGYWNKVPSMLPAFPGLQSLVYHQQSPFLHFTLN